jgi:hypothetical protein
MDFDMIVIFGVIQITLTVCTLLFGFEKPPAPPPPPIDFDWKTEGF